MIAQRRLAQAVARRSAALPSHLPRRFLSSPPAVADVEKATAPATVPPPTAAAAKPAAPAPPSGPKKAGTVWGRLVAFTVGFAVSSAYFYATLREDVSQSSSAIETTLAAAKADSAAVSEELRKRLAVLEHEVAALKGK